MELHFPESDPGPTALWGVWSGFTWWWERSRSQWELLLTYSSCRKGGELQHWLAVPK